jgi:hypothetical protein
MTLSAPRWSHQAGNRRGLGRLRERERRKWFSLGPSSGLGHLYGLGTSISQRNVMLVLFLSPLVMPVGWTWCFVPFVMHIILLLGRILDHRFNAEVSLSFGSAATAYHCSEHSGYCYVFFLSLMHEVVLF